MSLCYPKVSLDGLYQIIRLLYRVVTCCRFRVPKSVTLITIAALSMLGACYLTIYGGRGSCCEFDGSQNQTCYRRPDIDLPLAWFSVATCEKEPLLNTQLVHSCLLALTSVVLSFVLHLHETAMHAWLQLENDDNHGPPRFSHPTLRDSLELAKMRKSSDGNYPNPEEFPVCCPPPPYESSPTILSSYVLPSIPLRRRDMNKLGLTVITDIPAGLPFESPRKRWRGRGRDVWERKPLGASMKLERK